MTPLRKKIREIEAIELDEVPQEAVIEALFPKRTAFYQQYKHKPFHITCTKCGHSWDSPSLDGQDHCPHCHSDLKLEKCSKTKRYWCTDRKIAAKFEGHGEFQFVRWFCGQLRGEVGKPEELTIDNYETHRHVFDGEGNDYLFRRKIWGFMYSRWFVGDSPIKYQKETYYDDFWYGMDTMIGTPTYTEAFKYSRIDGDIEYGDYLHMYMRAFAKRDKELTLLFETVTQIGRRARFKHFLLTAKRSIHCATEDWLRKHSKQILYGMSIAYKMDHELVDNINDLEYMNKPLSRENVFPINMDAFRTKIQKAVSNRRRKKQREEMLEAERKQLETALSLQPSYEASHKKFFEVEIRQNGFVFIPLKSIKEFFDEGVTMNHCVFRNKYYENDNLQIYSVRNEKTNERIETLSIDLKNKSVQQCYGRNDTKTEFHNEIVSIAKENMSILTQTQKTVRAMA